MDASIIWIIVANQILEIGDHEVIDNEKVFYDPKEHI